MSTEPQSRTLADFTVELDVYSGPYEGLLALILKDELEIFEVPLRELVALYRSAYYETSGTSGKVPSALERDTNFVDSATSLVLLKGRALIRPSRLKGKKSTRAPFPPKTSKNASLPTSKYDAAPKPWESDSLRTLASTHPVTLSALVGGASVCAETGSRRRFGGPSPGRPNQM